jgi:DNA-3-methyladenine glycosylase II
MNLKRARALNRASLADAAKLLAARDQGLAFVLANHGTPPLWARRPAFSTLIQIILEQQVSLTSAASMFRRISANVVPLTPERFIELGERHLRSLGVTRQKASYCLHVARAVVEGGLSSTSLARMNDEDARTELMRVKGIGPWSADIYLLMALKRPDIWPVGDVALVTAITELKKLNARPSPAEFVEIAEPWRPFRAVAARMLWQYYLAQRNSSSPVGKKRS